MLFNHINKYNIVFNRDISKSRDEAVHTSVFVEMSSFNKLIEIETRTNDNKILGKHLA